MDFKTKARLEYEHQFFGFSSDCIIDSFKTLLRETITESAVPAAKKMLQKKLLSAAADPDALNKALSEMEESLIVDYTRGVDYGMESVEHKLKECFHIPDNVFLPEDQIIATVENEDSDLLDEEIKKLHEELKDIAIMMEELKAEQIIADEPIEVLQTAQTVKIFPLPYGLPVIN